MRSTSLALPRQTASLILLSAAFFIFLGLFYRTFSHADVAVASMKDPVATAALMQQLDSLDVDYRLRKDGTVVVDSADTPLLIQAGVPLAETKAEPQRLAQVLLLLVMMLTGISAVYIGREILRRINGKRNKQEMPPPDTELMQTRENTAEPMPHRAAVNAEARIAAKLFEAEHPQAVAIYLLTLEADAAASALEAMPVLQRERVWKRMATSGECDAVMRRRVAELFSAKLKRLHRQLRPTEVTQKMAAIFRLLSPETKSALEAMLRREDDTHDILAALEA